jgi:hypothetical protein
VYISRRARRGYQVRGCERISHKTLGYRPMTPRRSGSTAGL